MAPQDYLRTIDTVGDLLVGIRERLRAGEIDPSDAEPKIVDAADQAGMDLHFLCAVDEETLTMLVSPTGEVEPGRCWLTAELCYLDGLRCLAEDDDMGALARFTRALFLYGQIEADREVVSGFPTPSGRIAEIEELLPEAPPGL